MYSVEVDSQLFDTLDVRKPMKCLLHFFPPSNLLDQLYVFKAVFRVHILWATRGEIVVATEVI